MRIDREFMAQAVVALSIAVGGWLLLVQPTTTEIYALEARIDHAQEVQSTLDEAAVTQIAARVGSLRDRIESIGDRNELASDSSRLFGVVMNLADQYEIEVQSLQPGARRDAADEEKSDVLKTPVNLTVTGDYEAISQFVAALESLEGFIRPSSVRVRPQPADDGTSLVHARITCDAMAFPVPGTLAGLTGGSDVTE